MGSSIFRSKFSEDIFNHKYKHEGCETWEQLADTLVEDVCRNWMSRDEKQRLKQLVAEMKFIPGGRYLYYAGRPTKAFNNCYLFKSLEDTREDWAYTSWKHESALMTGGGTGNNYSVYRAEGTPLSRTGGRASGPLSKAKMTNEIGREVMQGGSRRSAMYGSLSCDHEDALKWIHSKDWKNMPVNGTEYTYADLKEKDFNFPCPLDMTNISINYNTAWLEHYKKTGEVGHIFLENVSQALRTAEPGFSFNFYEKENETGRNACTEVTSEDDCDVCNLGSVNMSRIETIAEFSEVVELGTKFLMCGTLVADLPFEQIKKIREKNRRLGLGLMGIHEWLLKRDYRYEMNSELQQWLKTYKVMSNYASRYFSQELGISTPVANRAIAPTGTLAIVAGTTSGIEPLLAVAFKRRYLIGKHLWKYQYVIDGTAKILINEYGINPDNIESALDLAVDYERRIKFQAGVQDYVDMSISSTINLPSWGSELNNEDMIVPFANTLAKYAERLRGFTCYPDGARGGQPITPVPYKDALLFEGEEFTEEFSDVCSLTGGGTCGV